jgi:CRISPR-associated protein Cmr4
VTHATEVLTRIRLEPDTKTVAHGALWTEEHLPVDTLLYAPVRATRLRIDQDQFPTDWAEIKSNPDGQAKAVLDFVQNSLQSRLQLGGDETVGRGIVGLKWS